MAKRRRKIKGSDAAIALCKIGTLAHNRAFTMRDAREYGASMSAVNLFKRRGWLGKGAARGELYPTKKGWRAVEIACALRHPRRS